MAVAERYGYHNPNAAALAVKAPAWNPTPEEVQAWVGQRPGASSDGVFGPGGQRLNGQVVPFHGCAGQAIKAVTGSFSQGSLNVGSLAESLFSQTLRASISDRRVVAVFRSWSRCMAQRGYSYHDPIDADFDPQWKRTTRPTQREVQTAVADQQCRAKENVVGVWYSVDKAYETQALEQHAEAMQQGRQQLEAQLKRAAQIVGSNP